MNRWDRASTWARGIATGDEVSIYYDPMLAKLICAGENRADAINKLDWALSRYVILGVATNIPYLRAILDLPACTAGDLDHMYNCRKLGEFRQIARGGCWRTRLEIVR